MDTKQELISCFEFIGQKLNDKMIEECLALCSKYDLTIEDFVDQWSAFTITNLKSASISLDGIHLLERKELSKLLEKHVSEITISENNFGTSDREAKQTPKTPQNNWQRSRSPDDSKVSSQHVEPALLCRSDQSQPESQPMSQQSYIERKDAGDIVATFGSLKDLTQSKQEASVEIISKSKWYIPEKFTYLQTTQMKVANAFNDTIDSLGQSIMKMNKLAMKTDINDSNDVIYGRIRSEDLGKLNANTVKLEGSYSFNGAKVINLNIKRTDSFSLFPGQIAATQGLNMVGNSFVPEEFFTSAMPEPLDSTPQFIDDLNLVIVAGPFSTSDNMTYDPLQDLLKFVVEKKPSVLILLGPFTDIEEQTFLTLNEPIESYFDSLVDTIMETINLAGAEIQVVLVSSPKDIHCHPIFPTPSYKIKQKYPNLTCAPNPCLLNINGLVVGATNADILFHLTKEEISKNPTNKDRMSRLASHLIDQRSFYPLYPSDRGLFVDYERLLNDCQMSVKPHVLILPSTLRYFIKAEKGCVFLNPERLVKNRIGGTFATLTVKPPQGHGLLKNISCQIRKI